MPTSPRSIPSRTFPDLAWHQDPTGVSANPDETADLVAKVQAAGGKAVGVQADVSTAADLHAMVAKAVETYGCLDVLINNAGVELGQHGIRVVNIAPGAVSTPINTSTENDPAKMKKLNASIPLGRMAQAGDIAEVVVFLASGKAAYMTATTSWSTGASCRAASVRRFDSSATRPTAG